MDLNAVVKFEWCSFTGFQWGLVVWIVDVCGFQLLFSGLDMCSLFERCLVL